MSARRALVAVMAGLTLALAACGGQGGSDPAPTAAPSTPDGVAAAFAAAYAAGDTPMACTFTAGNAAQRMTQRGQCAHTQWPAVQYWPGRVCAFTADDPYLAADLSGMHVFQFHTSGMVDGFPDFIVGVQPAGPTWRVTSVLADDQHQAVIAAQCGMADQSAAITGPSS